MNRLVINADLGDTTISRHIYGHFAEHLGRCIYGGIWVGEDSPAITSMRGIRTDIVDALRASKIPVLRWPGGCFADEYHWMDGIGPRSRRPTMINTHWGGVTEDNQFGAHEFFDLCEQLECEPYICGNVGSGTVQEMQQWVEYISFDGVSPMADLRRSNGREQPWRIRYWGVGNENWGCGGSMRPGYYADLYRQYQTYLRDFGDNQLYKVACGANSFDYRWTEVMMRECVQRDRFLMDGLSLHYYTRGGPAGTALSATGFGETQWFSVLKSTLRMDELLRKHIAIMDHYDPDGDVELLVDEWGTWYAVEPGTNPGFLYQQNSLRDALVAALNFDIFHRYASRVKMANIAQTVNVLQSMILTEGANMVCTPTYHVFEMYSIHQDATRLPIDLTCADYAYGGDRIPSLSATASRDDAGRVNLSLSNLHPTNAASVRCDVRGMDVAQLNGRVLTAANIDAHNTFDAPEQVQPQPFTQAKITEGGLDIHLPAKSIVVLTLEGRATAENG